MSYITPSQDVNHYYCRAHIHISSLILFCRLCLPTGFFLFISMTTLSTSLCQYYYCYLMWENKRRKSFGVLRSLTPHNDRNSLHVLVFTEVIYRWWTFIPICLFGYERLPALLNGGNEPCFWITGNLLLLSRYVVALLGRFSGLMVAIYIPAARRNRHTRNWLLLVVAKTSCASYGPLVYFKILCLIVLN